MRNGVDEGVMLLIAWISRTRKSVLSITPLRTMTSRRTPRKKHDSGAPAKQDPADVEEENDGDQPGAKNDEKRDRPAPSRQVPYSQLS